MDNGISEIQVACFRLGDDLYAMDIMRIKEIIRPQKLAVLPKAPSFMEGALNLRGTVIPVVDLRKRFDMPLRETDLNRRLLIVAMAGRSLGFVVDEVTVVITIPVANIKPPPQITNYVGAEYLIGVCLVGEEMVMLLNPDRLLTRGEANALGSVDETDVSPAGAVLI
ncbi:MAG TPA: chemotaxis protein CheW [Geobacteraceae bacterium]|nr:chemotaxis protein CheW [Geobacteraceae bacterium]